MEDTPIIFFSGLVVQCQAVFCLVVQGVWPLLTFFLKCAFPYTFPFLKTFFFILPCQINIQQSQNYADTTKIFVEYPR